MGLKNRFRKASKNKAGISMFPSTVMFEVEQYKIIDALKIPGCRSLGSKVRHLINIGLGTLTNDELGDTIEDRKKSIKESRERS